jgi:hypothetical protein
MNHIIKYNEIVELQYQVIHAYWKQQTMIVFIHAICRDAAYAK